MTSLRPSNNIKNICKHDKLVYRSRTLEIRAFSTETIVFSDFNKAIISHILDNQSLSADIKTALENLRSQLLELKYLLISKKFVRIILPRIEDQTGDYEKLLAKYQQDIGNPWATRVFTDSLNPEILKKLIDFDSRSARFNRDFFKKPCAKKYLKPHLIDGSSPIFSTKNTLIYDKFKSYFAKFIQYETEKLLCKVVLEKTGIKVNSFAEIHAKTDFEAMNEIPVGKLGINSKDLFIEAPFINFQKKAKQPIRRRF